MENYGNEWHIVSLFGNSVTVMNIEKADMFTVQGDFILLVMVFRLMSSCDHILHIFNLYDYVLFITEQYLQLFSSASCKNRGSGGD
jgi:hypothetical protein